jgi:hypothetical protein
VVLRQYIVWRKRGNSQLSRCVSLRLPPSISAVSASIDEGRWDIFEPIFIRKLVLRKYAVIGVGNRGDCNLIQVLANLLLHVNSCKRIAR